jgi:hypothetical protein
MDGTRQPPLTERLDSLIARGARAEGDNRHARRAQRAADKIAAKLARLRAEATAAELLSEATAR